MTIAEINQWLEDHSAMVFYPVSEPDHGLRDSQITLMFAVSDTPEFMQVKGPDLVGCIRLARTQIQERAMAQSDV